MKKVLAILLTLAMTLGMAGCGGAPQDTSGTAPVSPSSVSGSVMQADADEVYYMLAFYSGIEYWKGCYKGFTKAADMYGAKTEFGGPTNGDIAAYVDYMRSVIAKKPAGIALTCNDSTGLIDVINEARAAVFPSSPTIQIQPSLIAWRIWAPETITPAPLQLSLSRNRQATQVKSPLWAVLPVARVKSIVSTALWSTLRPMSQI